MSPGSLLTGAAQIEWRETLLLGDGTDLFVTNLTGWDEIPSLDATSVLRSQQHGAYVGRHLAQERVITVEFDMLPSTYNTQELREKVLAAVNFSVDGTEYPIVVQPYAGRPLMAYGRVLRRSLPLATDFQRRTPGCAIQWSCSDPRRYSINPLQVTVAAATAGSGYTFPLNYPIDYGTPTTPGVAYIINDGTAATPPVITFTGPVVRPRVVNQTSGDVLEFDITLVIGEQLVVDVGAGTVKLGVSSRIATLTSISVPPTAFELAPGPNILAFRGQEFPDPGATMTVLWRPASW